MACDLPVVEIAGDNLERVFGADGPARLAAPDPLELADALLRPARRRRRARPARGRGPRVRGGQDLGPRRRPARGRSARRAARPRGAARGRATRTPRARSATATRARWPRPSPSGGRRRSGCSRGWTRTDVAAVRERLDEEQAWQWEHQPDTRAARAALRRLARSAGGDREDRPLARRAARGRPRDGARPARRRRRALLRRPASAEALGRAAADIGEARRGLDFGCSSGRRRPRARRGMAGDRVARLRPERRRDRLGARAPARHRLRPLAARARRCPTTTAPSTSSARSRSGRTTASRPRGAWLGEMHRVLRPGGRLVLTAHGLQSVAHYARTGQRAAGRAGPRARRAVPRRASGSSTSSARTATGACATRSGARRSSRPSGCIARAVPALDGRGLRGRPQRRQPGRLRPAPPLRSGFRSPRRGRTRDPSTQGSDPLPAQTVVGRRRLPAMATPASTVSARPPAMPMIAAVQSKPPPSGLVTSTTTGCATPCPPTGARASGLR